MVRELGLEYRFLSDHNYTLIWHCVTNQGDEGESLFIATEVGDHISSQDLIRIL